MSTPLVIAAHGTRVGDGVAACHALVELVRERLPETEVSVGFVELTEPSIPEALVTAMDDDPRAVVVPLMLGTGGHVRSDIPEFIDEAVQQVPGAHVDYARHLGPDPRLIDAVEARLAAAAEGWDRSQTTVVFVGRGALVPAANADHVHLARMLFERGQWADVEPAFIQVTRPSLPEALERVHGRGARRIVVMGHWLFPGRLKDWTHQLTAEWADAHPDTQVRVAEIIGACPELADVVVERYREMLPEAPAHGSQAYLSGLLLAGRDVLVVGGGRIATRRVPKLVEAGAKVTVVAPSVTEHLRGLAVDGRLRLEQRAFEADDLADAWYVLAATDDAETNAWVAGLAEQRHTFCVRADDGAAGSAWTPATDDAHGITVAVIGNRDPRTSKAVKQAIVATLRGA